MHNRFATSPLLDSFVAGNPASRRLMNGVALVCVQHLLETTGSLVEKLIEIGLPEENVFVVGKLYSTSADVEKRLKGLGVQVRAASIPTSWGQYETQLKNDVLSLWATVLTSIATRRFKKVIVLDDGGWALSTIPNKILSALPIVGVEQTMSGVNLQADGHVRVPVVEVAASAAKKLIEPLLIQKAIFQRLVKFGRKTLEGSQFGVVGHGNIGKAVTNALLSCGKRVTVCDLSFHASEARGMQTKTTKRIEEVMLESDVIFGCTGQDIFKHNHCWRESEGRKTLVSCSSLDKEFRSVLLPLGRIPAPEFPRVVEDVSVSTRAGKIQILSGGFPINFDRSVESVPLDQIQLTRALLLAGVLQALSTEVQVRPGFADIPLSSAYQKQIVSLWFELLPEWQLQYQPQIKSIFNDSSLIERHSQIANQLPIPTALA